MQIAIGARRTRRVRWVVGLLVFAGAGGLGGCADDFVGHDPFASGGGEAGGTAGDGSSEAAGDDDDDDDGGVSSSGGADDDADTTGGGGSDGDDPTTSGPEMPEPACDIYEQDCPTGEKCTIWANDGGTFPNDVRCVPQTGDGVPGDACTVSGAQDGFDDCGAGNYCQVDDPAVDTEGWCWPFCQGISGNGNCEDPSMVCALWFGGVAPLCLFPCEIGGTDCEAGQVCMPQVIGDPVCVGQAWGDG